jgi:cytochrome c5
MAKWIDGRRLRRGVLLTLACMLVASAVVVLATGCGSSGNDKTTTVPTKKVVAVKHVATDRWTYARGRFREMCAGCHTLADAGARGRRFNLDRSTAVDENHVRATIAEGEPGMPAWRDVLAQREYEELVAYVVAVTRHQPGDDYWHRQIEMRTEGAFWTRADTRRLEEIAREIARRELARTEAAAGR